MSRTFFINIVQALLLQSCKHTKQDRVHEILPRAVASTPEQRLGVRTLLASVDEVT